MFALQTEEVAFGIQKYHVGCVITDASVDVETVIEAINALHEGSKKLVKSAAFGAFNKIAA